MEKFCFLFGIQFFSILLNINANLAFSAQKFGILLLGKLGSTATCVQRQDDGDDATKNRHDPNHEQQVHHERRRKRERTLLHILLLLLLLSIHTRTHTQVTTTTCASRGKKGRAIPACRLASFETKWLQAGEDLWKKKKEKERSFLVEDIGLRKTKRTKYGSGKGERERELAVGIALELAVACWDKWRRSFGLARFVS